jgi:type IV pilus assembly protein PilF
MKLKNIWLILLILNVVVACGQHPTKETETAPLEVKPGELSEGELDKLASKATQHKTDEQRAAEVNLQLGVEYMQRGQDDIALSRLRNALNIDENYADAHNAIAVMYQKLGQTAMATKHYERALALEPLNSDILNNYGQYLCQQGRINEAEQVFMKAVENPIYRKPEFPYTNAAICVLRTKQYPKAKQYLTKALQLRPNFEVALYQMAKLSYDTQHYPEAQDYIKRYVNQAQHTPQSLLLGIQIARALNDKNTESSYTMLLRSKFPNSAEIQQLN